MRDVPTLDVYFAVPSAHDKSMSILCGLARSGLNSINLLGEYRQVNASVEGGTGHASTQVTEYGEGDGSSLIRFEVL